jgi:hypothetical protein
VLDFTKAVTALGKLLLLTYPTRVGPLLIYFLSAFLSISMIICPKFIIDFLSYDTFIKPNGEHYH